MKKTALLLIVAGGLLFPPVLLADTRKNDPPRSGEKGVSLSVQEAERIVVLHNRLRSEVGVSPLSWSEELATYARQWVEHLGSSRCRLEHRPASGAWGQKYGENLFAGTIGHYRVEDAILAWGREKNKFNGEALSTSRWSGAGHYTQMVWKNTTRIGCAAGACKGNLVVVCNYDPPGNYLGQRPY